MRKLFFGGDILTMESPRPAEAVLTEGGRILAVGDLQVLIRSAGRAGQVEMVDLEGGALLPGFVDGDGDFVAAVRACMSELDAADAELRWGWYAVGKPSTKNIRAAVRMAAAHYGARGITVLHGRGMTAEIWRWLAHASLPLPLMAVADVEDYEEVKRAAASGREGMMQLCGMSLGLDTVDEGGEITGALTHGDRAVSYALRMAAAEGTQPVVRAESEAAVAQLLRVLRAMSRVCPELVAARPVLLSPRTLTLAETEQARSLGVIPCFPADLIPRLGDMCLRAWGMERAARLTPYAAVRQAGVPYTLCAAAGVTDPLSLLRAAVTRRTARGIVLGASECASVYDVLRALTVHGAWRYHAERAWGSIRAGMRADLVWLERNPLTSPISELGEIRIRATYAAGEAIWFENSQKISTQNEGVLSVY